MIPASQIPHLQILQERGWLYEAENWLEEGLKGPEPSIFFRKPLMMKESPFERTLYLDLDCHVLGDLSPLFSLQLGSTKMAVRTAHDSYEMKAIGTSKSMSIQSYNSGVVLFEHPSSGLDFWISLLNREIYSFSTDDRLLSFAISTYELVVTCLDPKYNWLYHWGPNPQAVIWHWIGEAGSTPCDCRQYSLLVFKFYNKQKCSYFSFLREFVLKKRFSIQQPN